MGKKKNKQTFVLIHPVKFYLLVGAKMGYFLLALEEKVDITKISV